MPDGPPSERRDPRVEMDRGATLIDHEGREFPIIITDISKKGFRLTSEEPLLPGDRVEILAEKGRKFPAIIKWALGNEAGGIFAEKVLADDL